MADSENTPKQKPDQKGKTKHRSPNYPTLSLPRAVDRAAELYRTYKRSLVPVGLAHKLWDYKEHSGAGNQVVSAMKSYGLLDVSGESEQRQVRVSELAYKVIESHPDRDGLLKSAALGPAIHKEVWAEYGDQGLPPDQLLEHFLKWKKNFNPDAIDGFIVRLRETVAFAKLDSADKVAASDRIDPDDGTSGNGGEPGGDMTETKGAERFAGETPIKRPPARDAELEQWAGPRMMLDLPRGNRIEIRLRAKVTPEEFRKIQRIYELSELSFLTDEPDGEDGGDDDYVR